MISITPTPLVVDKYLLSLLLADYMSICLQISKKNKSDLFFSLTSYILEGRLLKKNTFFIPLN
jgi:hypothetical protein